MRTSEAFPSKYLAKEDVGDQRMVLTIAHVKMEKIKSEAGEDFKPIVYFDEQEKGMVLNKGNAEAITEAAGGDDEMDNWRGVRVILYVDRNVQFGGKRVGGLRIDIPAGKAKPAKPKPVHATAAAGMQYTEDNPPPPTDDDMPNF